MELSELIKSAKELAEKCIILDDLCKYCSDEMYNIFKFGTYEYRKLKNDKDYIITGTINLSLDDNTHQIILANNSNAIQSRPQNTYSTYFIDGILQPYAFTYNKKNIGTIAIVEVMKNDLRQYDALTFEECTEEAFFQYSTLYDDMWMYFQVHNAVFNAMNAPIMRLHPPAVKKIWDTVQNQENYNDMIIKVHCEKY